MYALIALLLPFAGCAAMMAVCAVMMRRGNCSKATAADAGEVARLRAEVAELRARLDPTGQANRDQLPAR